jgi:hypothetical protein
MAVETAAPEIEERIGLSRGTILPPRVKPYRL